MKKDIEQIWYFDQPITTVWQYLTDPELVSQWLMKNTFKPQVGHQFNFYSKPIKRFNWDGVVHCEVLTLLPEQKLSYSWKGIKPDGTTNLDTIVTWTLKPKGTGTELTLQHTGFKGFSNYISAIIMDKGWSKKIRQRLLDLLNCSHARV